MPPASFAPDLVVLDPDHPGFRDAAYRARRNAIAAVALAHRSGDPVPRIAYTDDEHATWARVQRDLRPLHARLACRSLRELRRALPLDARRIPQLQDVSSRLAAATGFRMEPVAGLVAPRAFMSRLGDGVFLATQYMRHPSRPHYTPEPDVVHELIGHAFTLAHAGLAGVNSAFGAAAQVASGSEMKRLESVYWYTLEFGLAQDDDGPRAFGAGLLSSAGELQRFRGEARLLPWDLEAMARTPYDPTAYQPGLFVAPSLPRMLEDVGGWLSRGDWRDRPAR